MERIRLRQQIINFSSAGLFIFKEEKEFIASFFQNRKRQRRYPGLFCFGTTELVIHDPTRPLCTFLF